MTTGQSEPKKDWGLRKSFLVVGGSFVAIWAVFLLGLTVWNANQPERWITARTMVPGDEPRGPISRGEQVALLLKVIGPFHMERSETRTVTVPQVVGEEAVSEAIIYVKSAGWSVEKKTDADRTTHLVLRR